MANTSIFKTWRDDPGMVCVTSYEKKFAFFPVACSDGKHVWLTNFYKKYNAWASAHNNGSTHIEFTENVSEEDYVVRKLSGSL